jgi:hypothetical protein
MTPKEAKQFRDACRAIRRHISSNDTKTRMDFESVVRKIVITNLREGASP